MAKQIPTDALVVVADGGKAVLLRNKAHGDGVDLHEERRVTPHDLAAEGPSGSRPEDQTPKQTDEATFAKQLAETLYKMHHAGKYESLVLIADPQTLGQIRDAMHKSVEGSVVFTLSKDYTNHSAQEITKHLS